MNRIISWLAVVLWMAFIFYLSHQPAAVSNEMSKGVTEVIIETVEKTVPNHAAMSIDVDQWNRIVRKNAHFFAYFVLGLFVIHAMKVSWQRKNGWQNLALALGFCILYAILDEVHQLFVPGRGGQVKDVLIDAAGAAFGVILYLLMQKGRMIFIKDR